MAGFVINDRFIVQGVGKGLLELKDNQLTLLKNTQEIANDKVQSICLYENNQILINTLAKQKAQALLLDADDYF